MASHVEFNVKVTDETNALQGYGTFTLTAERQGDVYDETFKQILRNELMGAIKRSFLKSSLNRVANLREPK